MYNIEPKPFMVRVAEDTQLYQVIHIDGSKLRYESRTANGELYDAFELAKEIGKTNQLVEIPVQMPQRLRKTLTPTADQPANAQPAVPSGPNTVKPGR
jgi:hypothetical protein